MAHFIRFSFLSQLWQLLLSWLGWAVQLPAPESDPLNAGRDSGPNPTPGPLTQQPAALPDPALIQLVLKRGTKDDRPFRELFQRYQKMVWQICYRFTNNAQDAEDLTQEVFFKVYRNLDRFKGNAAFKTWLHRIAVNTCQSELRRRSRRPQRSDTPIETMEAYLPSSETPERVLGEKNRAALLTQTFAQLKESEYEVLHLRELEKRSYAEIAETLGISLSAAKMRVQRARLTFQAAYTKLEA